jgi:hypothetical protein
MMRTVIVGNAPVTRDHAALVDGGDRVVRFNVPATWDHGTGRRFDVWVIANGGAGRRFARQRPFAGAPYRALPAEIWFPRLPGVHGMLRASRPDGLLTARSERDFAEAIVRENGLTQPWRRLDPEFYRRCLDLLRAIDAKVDPTSIPSAGFMALNQVFELWPDDAVTLVGFTFQGWPGHPWAIEETFVRRAEAAGRLTLVPS